MVTWWEIIALIFVSFCGGFLVSSILSMAGATDYCPHHKRFIDEDCEDCGRIHGGG